jgi:hypothetical protein
LIDETEKVWLLRSLVAKMLRWFNSDKFLVVNLSHTNSIKALNFGFYFSKLFEADEIQLSYKDEDENLQYFIAQFLSWYSKKSGIVLQYSECLFFYKEFIK